MKKRIGLLSAVTLLFVTIMITTGGNDPRIFDLTRSVVESKAESATSVSPATGSRGQSVRDNTLSFIVTSMQRSGRRFTDRIGATQTAQGVFVEVWVNITNISPRARTPNATDQFLVDRLGRRYPTSPVISALPSPQTTFQIVLNPGQTVNGAPLLFDVPAGTPIASIELHDSATSTGVRIKLP